MITREKPNRLREPYLSIVNAVNERDREFFAAHPKETAFLRPYCPGENAPEVFHDLGVTPPGLDDWVLVHNIAPGIRCRQPIGQLTGPRPMPPRFSVILPDGTSYERVPVFAGDRA